MKKRNLKPTQTAPVERPQAGGKSANRDPLAMFAAGGIVASTYGRLNPAKGDHPFAGDDAE